MTTQQLKEQLLSKSFGGIMYDVTEGSEITQLVLDNEAIANVLVEQLDKPEANGIDKGVKNFICGTLAKDMANA
jgi:hypothetical protein